MSNVNIARATKLAIARVQGQQSLHEVEQQVVDEVIPPTMLAHDPECRTTRCSELVDCSDFEATRQVGLTLGNLFGNPGRYDLTICSDRVFRGLWTLRQVIDQTGISQRIYLGIAIDYVCMQGGRVTLGTLIRPDVIAYVLDVWATGELHRAGMRLCEVKAEMSVVEG